LRAVFIDTNVFLYALGRPHPYRDPCRDLIDDLRQGRLAGETSVEVIQEFVHVRRAREEDAIARGRELMAFCAMVHDLEARDLARAMDILDDHPALPTRDAIHAATAINRDLNAILTADRHFDAVHGLERIDPLDSEAVDALKTRA